MTILDDRLFALSFRGQAGVQLRSLRSGDLLWQRDLGIQRVTAVSLNDGAIIASGGPTRDVLRFPAFRVTALSPQDGEVMWSRAVHRPFDTDSDPVLVLMAAQQLSALDIHTGDKLWGRQLPGPTTAVAGDGPLVLATGGRIEVLDPRTGSSLREAIEMPTDLEVAPRHGGLRSVQRHGNLLAVNTPLASGGKLQSTMLLFDLSTEAAEPGHYPGTTGLAEVDGGLVVVSQDASHLRIVGLDHHGQARWEHTVPAGPFDGRCCFTPHATGGGDEFYLAPPSFFYDAVRRFHGGTGDPLDAFRMPTISRSSVEWIDGVGIAELAGRTSLTGPAGTVEVPSNSSLLPVGSPLVVRISGGLIGIDPAFVTELE